MYLRDNIKRAIKSTVVAIVLWIATTLAQRFGWKEGVPQAVAFGATVFFGFGAALATVCAIWFIVLARSERSPVIGRIRGR
jgi:hypothetical protein